MDYQLIIDDYIGPWGCSKRTVRNALSSMKGKHIDVKISSLGGDLIHAFDIRQQFIDHGDVTVYLSGGVASAATVIAMGAKRVVISKYAMFLVHKCSNFIDVFGSYNADQMQEIIEKLEANKDENDKIDSMLAALYADKCKKKVTEIMPILKKGGWITPQDALDFGFVDEVSDSFGKESKFKFNAEMAAKFNAMGITTLGLVDDDTSDESSVSTGLLDRIASATAKAFSKLTGTDAIAAKSNVSNQEKSSTSSTVETKKFNFSKILSVLKIDSIETAADGKVTVTGEQLEEVNDRLDALEKESSAKDDTIAKKDDEIKALKEQVENLKKNPGEDTDDIEDSGSSVDDISAADLYNSIKEAL